VPVRELSSDDDGLISIGTLPSRSLLGIDSSGNPIHLTPQKFFIQPLSFPALSAERAEASSADLPAALWSANMKHR